MDNVMEIQVNIEIKGKGAIKSKTLKIEGSNIFIESIAGAWFWIKQEGCFKMGDDVFYVGEFDPKKEISCNIIPSNNGDSIDLPSDKISFNNIEFIKLFQPDKPKKEKPVDEVKPPEKPATQTAEPKKDEIENKDLKEAGQKIAALEDAKSKLESENLRLKTELEKATQQLISTVNETNRKLQQSKQMLIATAKEKRELENKLSETSGNAEQISRKNDSVTQAYKNEIESLKAQIGDMQNEQKLTIETYEKSLQDRRNVFAKINKWMSKVSGMDEKINPTEKAARIESLVLERWSLIDENKRLRVIAKSGGGETEEHKPAVKKPSEIMDMQDRHEAEELEKAFRFVVGTILMKHRGEKYGTLDKMDKLINGFYVIDPADEGISEKDLCVIRDYFELKTKGQSESGTYDMGAMINLFKDILEKIIELPELADPQIRSGMRLEYREVYDGYIPKSSR